MFYKAAAQFALVALVAADCAANNCIRALQNPTRPAVADCRSYLFSTTTPTTTQVQTVYTTLTPGNAVVPGASTSRSDYTVTTTTTLLKTETSASTSTVYSTTTPARKMKRQTPSPKPTPAYASACSNVERYTSACSCIGVVTTTVTAATVTSLSTRTVAVSLNPVGTAVVTSYSTTTISTTVTTTSTVAAKPKTFYVQANGGQYTGYYAFIQTCGCMLHPFIALTSDRNAAKVFAADSTGRWTDPQGSNAVVGRPNNIGGDAEWLPNNDGDYSPITCQINDDLSYTCTYNKFNNAQQYFKGRPDYLDKVELANSPDYISGTSITFSVVPISY